MINVNNILLSGYQKQTTLLVTDTALFLTSLMEKNVLFNQRIRLRHLHTFVAVAQQGTLGRAAETLNLSQPALSKTLNELEQLTGTRLFERGRLGAQLTLPRAVSYPRGKSAGCAQHCRASVKSARRIAD